MTSALLTDHPDDDGILFAYALQGNGIGRRIDGAETSALLQREDSGLQHEEEDLVWVHMDTAHPGTRPWLEKEIGHFDPLVIDALLAEETRPRLVEFDSGLLVILRGVNMNPDADPEDMVSVRLWIDGFRIITLRRRRLHSIADVRKAIDAGKGPREAGDFLSMLCVGLQQHMEPVITALDDEIDALEERILEKPDPRLRPRINALRVKAIMLRRYIAPQRDVVAQLRVSEKDWISARDRRHLQESVDRLTRYIEDLDAIRERAQIVKDELSHNFSERMNRNMFVLSIVSAVFLPLTFLTGLLGMNVAGIPLAQHAEAFWIICGFAGALSLVQVMMFKWMKWF